MPQTTKATRKVSKTALNIRERKFVDLYIQHYLSGVPINATALARRADYAPKSADVSASRLLSRDKVKLAIDDGLSKAGLNSRISEATILRELRKVALSDTTPVQAKLKALELLGKTLTMFSERTVVAPELPSLSADEVLRYRQISAALDRPALASPNIPADVLDDDQTKTVNDAAVLDDEVTGSEQPDGETTDKEPARVATLMPTVPREAKE